MGKPQLREFHTLFKQVGLTPHVFFQFRGVIWQHYHEHGRMFLWWETGLFNLTPK